MLKSFVTAVSFTALCASIGVLAAESQYAPPATSPYGCMTLEGSQSFSAQYTDPATNKLVERVTMPPDGVPVVIRMTDKRGVIRAKCEAMVLEKLGFARGRLLLKHSD